MKHQATMRRSCLLLLAALLLSLTLPSCAPQTHELAVVTDVGQLMDQGFNQGAYEGVQQFAEAHGLTYTYYSLPGGAEATDVDRVSAMYQAVAGGARVVVAAGYLQAEALRTAAQRYPHVKFVFVDGFPLTDAQGAPLPNVVAVSYKEHESGYLAGYAAVMEGYTRLGFSGGGGGNSVGVNRFGYGYMQGISDAACQLGVDVELRYSYRYGSTFSPSAELQTQLSGWYHSGTQIIFSCGGSMLESTKAAAEAHDGRIIGVDRDQSFASPRVVTSAVKDLRASIVRVLEIFYDGRWDSELGGRTLQLGARDGAIGLPTGESWRMERFTEQDYEALLNRLRRGEIEVRELPETDFSALTLPRVRLIYE